MSKIIKFLLFFSIIFFMVGCSNKEVNQEQIDNLFKNTDIEKLLKIDYNQKENEIIFYIDDEILTEDDFKNSLNKYSINKINGIDALSQSSVRDISDKFKFIYKNNNEFLLKTKNSKITSKISATTYSDEYVKNNFKNISKNIISFNDLAGRIEIDIKKNSVDLKRVEEINRVYTELSKIIDDTKSRNIYNDDNSKNNLDLLEKNLKIVKTQVDKAIEKKQSNLINNVFLNINELDKIARNFE